MEKQTEYDKKINSIVELFKGDKLEFAEAVLKEATNRLKSKATLT
ncbi:hypothetical protein [Flavobacterium rakeshii]|nr:hypothetical protein [Flavobacterium rakeshii]